MKKKFAVLSGFVLSLAPVVAFAQAANTGTAVKCTSAVGSTAGTLGYIICKIGDLFNLVLPVLIALAVIYFVWGVASYVISADEEAKTAGRDKMI